MADIIKTNYQQYLVGGSGAIRITDTTEYDNLKVLTIIPEEDCTFDTLVVVGPDGEESDATASIASGGRNLGTMKAGNIYTAGENSYFKTIKLGSAVGITCHRF